MADRKMNSFLEVTDTAYIYGEFSDGSQIKISKSDLAEIIGIYSFFGEIKGGEQIELPYTDGLIIIQSASNVHDKSLAIVTGGNYGNIMIPNELSLIHI